MPDTATGALSAAEFALRLERLGPFEPAPHLAVAVSGGADSMALALLAERWARDRGGRASALIVDHRLRPDSGAEAIDVATRLAARGIAAFILTREGGPLQGDVQASARQARYGLLAEWCRRQGVLHLLTAHHRDDQAETLLLRLARGSGLAGLAAMAPLVETDAYRLLRPLLDVPAARLRAVLAAAGETWIDDPSNRDPVFARVRMRQAGAALAALGLTAPRLAATAGHLARTRAALDPATERLLAEAVALHPAGFARLDPVPLGRAPDDLALRVLAAVLTTVGGADYPPRFERLARLADILLRRPEAMGGGRTLAGCRVVAGGGGILIQRETAAIAAPAHLAPGAALRWDGRFLAVSEAADTLTIGALGAEDARRLRAELADDRRKKLAAYPPNRVWPSLPALRREARLISVPMLGWVQKGHSAGAIVQFLPIRPLSDCGFTVV